MMIIVGISSPEWRAIVAFLFIILNWKGTTTTNSSKRRATDHLHTHASLANESVHVFEEGSYETNSLDTRHFIVDCNGAGCWNFTSGTGSPHPQTRSEEHTSELQSHSF